MRSITPSYLMTTTLSKQQLAEILLVKLGLRHSDYTFSFDKNRFKEHSLVQIHVLHNEKKILSCSIDQLYQSYQDSPQDLDALCAPLLNMVNEFLESTREEKSILLPMVTTQARLEEKKISQDTSIFSIPLVANLLITFVLDRESRLTYLTSDQLKKIYPKVDDVQTLYELALSNLSLLLPQLKIESSSLFEATLRLDYKYELSMLLIFDQWKHLLPFESAPVIAIPSRDSIIFANGADLEQVKALKKVIANMHDYDTPPLVEELLTIQNNTLQILEITL